MKARSRARRTACRTACRRARPRSGPRIVVVAAAAVTAALLDSAAAFGGTGGTDMPWNGPMQAILDNITGPTGKIIAGLLIALGGIVWGFTRHEEGFKRVAQAIIAIGLVLGATNLVTTLGFQGCVF
jgi:type IV secretory pathway VirB2 component (pilin)